MAGFFGMFDYSKPGKGVSKEDAQKSGIELYFDILSRRLWKLIKLNLIYILFSIPAIVIGWYLSRYAVISAVNMLDIKIDQTVALGVRSLYMLLLILVLQLCGTGPASAAMCYVLRKYVNDTHSWVWSDFFDAFKENFFQGIAAYIINTAIFFLCVTSAFLYPRIAPGFSGQLLSAFITIFLAVFLMMQMYVYQIMSGFKLSVKNIYKNAAILTLAKLPWNILSALVSCIFFYGIYMAMASIFMLGEFLAIVILYSLITFTQVFMTNNVMKKYLQEPFEKNTPCTEKDEVFEDK